jgi:hypothetical protein
VAAFQDLDAAAHAVMLPDDDVYAYTMEQVTRDTLPHVRHGGLRFLPRTLRRPVTRNFTLPVCKHLCAGTLDGASALVRP